MANGGWVDVDEGWQDADDEWQDTLLTHPPASRPPQKDLAYEAAQVYGVPPSQVDFTGPKFAQRLGIGLLDDPENIRQNISAQYPGQAEIIDYQGRPMVAFQRPDGTVSFANPPGVELGDVGEFATREGPAVAGGILGAAVGMPGGLPGVVAGTFAGAETGETVRRGLLRPAMGGAELSAADAGPITTMGAVEAAGPLGARVLRGPVNLLSGRGYMKEGPLRTHLTNVHELAAENPNLPVPGPHRLTESRILGQSGKQVGSTTAILANREKEMQQQGVDLLRSTLKDQAEKGSLVPELRDIAQDYVDRADAAIRWPLRRPETGGQAATDALDRWVKTSKTEVTKAYNTLDQVAAEQKPVFDLTPVQGIRERYRLPAPTQQFDPKTGLQEYLNVAESPQGKLSRIATVIDSLDPVQTDYKVLKELRTQTGEIIENWPWDADTNSGIAKRVYGDISKAISTAGGDFAEQHGIAAQMAKMRFDMLDNPSMRTMLAVGKDSPAKLAKIVASDSTLLSPKVTQALTEQYNQADLDTFRLSLMDKFATSRGSARSNFKSWWTDNPTQARKVFGGRYAQANQIVKAVDTLNGTRIAKIAQDIGERTDVLKQLVEGVDPRTAKDLVKQVGGKNSRGHTIARVAVHENIVDRAVKTTSEGEYLDPKVFYEEIEKLKTSGTWAEILNPGDRKRLKQLQSYAYLTRPEAGDTGVSLQRAAAVANLRHPASFAKGVHTLSVNRAIATALSNDKLSRAWMGVRIGTGKAPVPKIDLDAAAIFAAGMVNYYKDMGR